MAAVAGGPDPKQQEAHMASRIAMVEKGMTALEALIARLQKVGLSKKGAVITAAEMLEVRIEPDFIVED